jgi:hypothetical protein
MNAPGLALTFTPEMLRPIIREVVEETMRAMETDRERINGKIAYSEAEAAALISLEPHQLRDERLRGRIKASAIVGRRIRYTRQDILEYLAGRPWRKD